MVEWDLIIQYQPDIEEIAGKLCSKADPSLAEDAAQHAMVVLKEKLNLNLSQGPHREYIRGAIWNVIQDFLKSRALGQWEYTSLDQLLDEGVQIDEEGTPRWPRTFDGSYTGSYRSKDGTI